MKSLSEQPTPPNLGAQPTWHPLQSQAPCPGSGSRKKLPRLLLHEPVPGVSVQVFCSSDVFRHGSHARHALACLSFQLRKSEQPTDLTARNAQREMPNAGACGHVVPLAMCDCTIKARAQLCESCETFACQPCAMTVQWRTKLTVH